MVKVIVKRTLLALLTLWIVSLIIFVGTEILPGDVATAILGQSKTPEALAAIREALQLDRPAYIRYLNWLFDFVRGDIGQSLASQRDMTAEILARLGNTMFLAGTAAMVAVPLSVMLGLLAATRPNGIVDRIINTFALSTISLPEFFVGYLLILVFSIKLELFPSLAMIDSEMGLLDRLYAVALPATALVLVVLAHIMRQTRAAVLNVLARPFIEMAVLKGIPRWRIVVEHALPSALAPIFNVIALNLAYLIVGVVVVEVVFVYPGMGRLLVDSVSKRDVPVVQTCGLIFALVYVALNMLADILGILTNPRLRDLHK